MKKSTLFLLLLFCQKTALHSQTIWHVNQHANGTQTGLNWPDAFQDLQSALALAAYGDQIWVSAGIYTPTLGTDRDKSFRSPIGVGLFGGFAATESQLAERDIEANPTTLSGEIGNPTIKTDNSHHVVVIMGGDSLTIVDGFVIKDGRTESSTAVVPLAYGGGILVWATEQFPVAVPIIKNCHFEGNYGDKGASIACLGDDHWVSSPIISSCTFLRNYATYSGAGIYKYGINQQNRPFMVYDCQFERNYSKQFGGGISIIGGSGEVAILKSDFKYDSARVEAGGVYLESMHHNIRYKIDSCYFGSNYCFVSNAGVSHLVSGNFDTVEIVISNSYFLLNKTFHGSGCALYSGFAGVKIKFIVENVVFEANISAQGGAFKIEAGGLCHSDVWINRCLFFNNLDHDWFGPAYYYGGFGAIDTRNRTTITNSVFIGNPGAIGVYAGNPGASDTRVVNCTFYNNNQIPFSKYWGPDFDYVDFYTKMQIYNSIIWEPSAPDPSWLFYNNDGSNFNVNDYEIDYCLVNMPTCVYAGVDPCGPHMIYGEYPEFGDTLEMFSGGWIIRFCTPARDVGSNMIADTFGLAQDFYGNDRIRFGQVDLGAFELPGLCVSATGQPLLQDAGLIMTVLKNPILQGESSQVEIFSMYADELMIRLFDSNGQIQYETTASIGSMLPIQITFPRSKMAHGVHLVSVTNKKGVVLSKKIVVAG